MHLLTAPHGTCYLWDRTLVWGFFSTDIIIALSYFFISFTIVRLVAKPPFAIKPEWEAIAYLFVTFISFCGATHLISAIEIWFPFYRSHLVFGLATAGVSATTACLFPLVSKKGVNIAELAESNIRDPLTGLYSRKFAEHELQREKEKCDRYAQQMAIVMLDLDHFKQINDNFGHLVGDEVLQRVAAALQERLRLYDVIARYGEKADEMMVLIPNASAEIGLTRANSMLEAARALGLRSPGSKTGLLTCSGGVAVYPDHGKTVKEVLKAADKALYQAKKGGRDRVVVAQ